MSMDVSARSETFPSECSERRPAWLEEALEGARPVMSARRERPFELRGFSIAGIDLFRASAPDAGALEGSYFVELVASVYVALLGLLDRRGLHPLRFWNYLPDIHRAVPGFGRRYEAFSTGRYAAYNRVFRGHPWPLAAASAVGHHEGRLEVDLLASKIPGEPIENPRQIPAYRYSRTYGEFPPFFTRAIRVGHPLPSVDMNLLAIVSGTASIMGEESQHAGDLKSQTEETLLNLSAVAGCVTGERRREHAAEGWASRHLVRYRELRAYVPRAEDGQEVAHRLWTALPNLKRLEVVRADLCRPELRLEVEGLLCLNDGD